MNSAWKIKFREVLLLSLISIIFTCFISCRSSKFASTEGKNQAETIFAEYSNAIATAEKLSDNEEFDKLFLNKGIVTLKGNEIKNLSQFRVGKNGNIYICDYDQKLVNQYDSLGNNVTSIGNTGNKPGSHVFPTDVAEIQNSSIAIADFQGHRVNVFSKDGSFDSSFIYTPQNFSAQRVIYNNANDSYYLFGNRWETNENDEIIGADLLHKYSSKGDYLTSHLQFPDEAKALDLYSYDSPASDLNEGNIYLALPFDYTVYRLTAKDELSVFLKGDKPDFVTPKTKMSASKVNPADSYKLFQTWRLKWTPIVSLAVLNGKLLVQYQSFNPLRYTIDVWSIPTKKLETTIKTNYMLLNRGLDNNLFFLKNLESKEQATYEIIRAEIR